ncbi:MAG: ABC transporter ATP-binding protein [Methylococcaceae bacterium]|nr:MAG: ABC transporter ATP-binding protein [Methylococcaceae bacterium]
MVAKLALESVSVAYGAKPVVNHVSFSVAGGEIACLLGPSGCGKTSLLRAIAGFEPLAAGRITLAGSVVSDDNTLLPPERRQLGIVFQDYALFPHLTVADNVAYGMRGRNAAVIADSLELVGLTGLEGRYPHELSGGQQQRVALARALAPQPSLLLIDEPFSNLDTAMREHLALELRRMLKAAGVTAVLVTHDQQEAFAMADAIGVLRDGCLLQWGDADTLYHRPVDRFVAEFIGQGTLLPVQPGGSGRVATELGEWACDCALPAPGWMLFRPNQLYLGQDGVASAVVENKVFRGVDILYTARLASGRRLLSSMPNDTHYAVGDRCNVKALVSDPVLLRD